MKNLITRLAAVSVLALTLATGLNRVSAPALAAEQHSVQVSGGYVDPATNTNAALYTNCSGNAGQVSRTTATSHEWGFVSNVQYVSASEAIITAPEYGTGNIIVEDVRADTQSISFAVYDADGSLVDGSPDLVPARVRIVIR